MAIILEKGIALVMERDNYPDTGESGASYDREMEELDLWVSYRHKNDLERMVQGTLGRLRTG